MHILYTYNFLQEVALSVAINIADKISQMNPAENSFSEAKDASSLVISSLVQVAFGSARTAKYNSTEYMFNISGSSPNMTGMVSNTERVRNKSLYLDIFLCFTTVSNSRRIEYKEFSFQYHNLDKMSNTKE